MPTYPRTTLAAIAAALAGTAGTVVIGLALINAAINGQTITPASVYATSTVSAPTVNATTTASVTSTVTGILNSTLTSSTQMSIGQGTAIDWHKSGTATIDPNSMAALGSSTSSAVTVTGASTGDSVMLTRPSAWAGQPALIHGYISGASTLTINFVNVTSTALDLASGAVTYDIWSH